MNVQEVWQVASAILASLGGATVVVVGLSTWLGKLWAKRILQNESFSHQQKLEWFRADLQKAINTAEHALAVAQEREKAELEHRVNVSKAQFELEFKAYQEIWGELTTLRRMGIVFWLSVRDHLSSVGTLFFSPEEIDKLELRLKEIEDATIKFSEFHVYRSPFIDGRIEAFLRGEPNIASAILGIARQAVEAARANDAELLVELEDWQKGVNAEQEKLAKLIRSRLSSVSIVA